MRAVVVEAPNKVAYREVAAPAVGAEGGPLAVGHSPTNETAVLGLIGSIIEPMPRAAARFVVADGSYAHIEAAR